MFIFCVYTLKNNLVNACIYALGFSFHVSYKGCCCIFMEKIPISGHLVFLLGLWVSLQRNHPYFFLECWVDYFKTPWQYSESKKQQRAKEFQHWVYALLFNTLVFNRCLIWPLAGFLNPRLLASSYPKSKFNFCCSCC